MPAATLVVPTPALTPSQPHAAPELNELEDLLYDLLATGVADPNVASSALDATQKFLHEHARVRKSHQEFVAFFEAHGLSLRPERLNLLALPVLDTRGRASEAPVLMPEPEREPLVVLSQPAADGGKVERRTPASPWQWAAVFAAVSCTTALAVTGLLELRDEFTRVHDEAAQHAASLEQLRIETQSLRAQLNEANQLLRENQRDTQLLLRTFASPLD